MKKLYLFAALAAMLAACSENDLTKETAALQQTAEEGAISFDAYTQRGVTRAGQTGVLKTDNLKLPVDKVTQKGGGFGVFGYYTDNNDYEQSRMPDFMYNQLVEWTGSYWKYEPIKYWPNEYGSSAISDDADKVTFFAYAPYVETNGSGKIERTTGDDLTSYGITGLSRNSNQGDPIVKYIASFERDKSVDLLWGIVGSGEVDNWNLTNGGKQTNLEVGKPWLNVMRPAEAATQAAATQRVKFTFAHALTQLTMNIDAIVDEITKGSNTLAAGTKIYVRQLSMTGVALKGALNLNNTETEPGKAVWLDYNGLADIESGVSVVLYDGRKDGKEGVAGATASNEKIIGFNPNIISNDGNNSDGVTAEAQLVFADDPVMLIPTGENMELEIIYDVETVDDKLPTLLSDGKKPGSSIENKVRKTIDFPKNGIANGLENGKHYTINLHLGMNSVKFDVANVEEWSDVSNQPQVDLPSNGSSSVSALEAAANKPLSYYGSLATLPYDATTYTFSVKGLTANEAVTKYVASEDRIDALYDGTNRAEVTVGSTLNSNDGKADDTGVVYVTVTLPGNKTVHNLTAADDGNYILIEGQTSLKGWKARFAQEAHPFGLEVTSVANDDTKDVIVLNASATGVSTDALNLGGTKAFGAYTGKESDFVKVSVGGVALTYASTPTTVNEYSYNGATKTITIGGHLAVGQEVTITVAASKFEDPDVIEDGANDVVTFTIGGISFGSNQTLPYSATAQNPLEPTVSPVSATPTKLTYTQNGSGSFYSVTDNKISTSNDGSESDAIKCVAEFADPGSGAAIYYTETSCTATYDLIVTEVTTTLTWNTPTEVVTDIAIAENTPIVYDKNVSVDASGTALTSTDLTGYLTYAVTSVKVDGGDAPANTIVINDAAAGTIKVGSAGLVNAKNYEVVITATYNNETNTGYKAHSATKTITVQSKGF